MILLTSMKRSIRNISRKRNSRTRATSINSIEARGGIGITMDVGNEQNYLKIKFHCFYWVTENLKNHARIDAKNN